MTKLPPVYAGNRFRLSKADASKIVKALVDLKQKTRQLTIKDIASWRAAYQMALNVDNPRRQRLYEIYEDIMIDGHLTGAIENNRKLETLQKAFKIVDKNGKEMPEITQWFEAGWFKSLLSYILDSRFYGHSLIQLGDYIEVEGKPGFSNVVLLPREHVSPEFGVIINEPSDEWKKGTPYREYPLFNWLIEAGGTRDMGLLNKCCRPAISKKNVLAYWDEFAEIFGMPIRVGTTNSRDKREQNKIADMLENMGSAAWGLFPTGTTIDLKESTRGDAYNVYDKRVERSDKEMSKAILGQTMTMDNGASKSQGEVHERVLQKVIEADADFCRDIINNQLIPKLIALGWKLNGMRLDWDEQTSYTPDEQNNMDRLVLEHYEVDPKYFVEKGYPIIGKKEQKLGRPGFFQ